MIEPSHFRQKWEQFAPSEPWVCYEPQMFAGLAIPAMAVEFMLRAGLPESAAPYLNLRQLPSRALPSVCETWKLPEQFALFREIGFDGEGSPICIDEETGRVVLLDHDSGFAVQLINSSIPQFAESLLAYESFIANVIAANGHEAFLDNDIRPADRKRLEGELDQFDSAAVQAGCFWRAELTRLAGPRYT